MLHNTTETRDPIKENSLRKGNNLELIKQEGRNRKNRKTYDSNSDEKKISF
jgi:hypothetical protein